MKVEALRGVCIGVDRHLKAGDTADLEPATVQFLLSINAVRVLKDPPAPSAPEPTDDGGATGEPAGDAETPPAKKTGKKEK